MTLELITEEVREELTCLSEVARREVLALVRNRVQVIAGQAELVRLSNTYEWEGQLHYFDHDAQERVGVIEAQARLLLTEMEVLFHVRDPWNRLGAVEKA